MSLLGLAVFDTDFDDLEVNCQYHGSLHFKAETCFAVLVIFHSDACDKIFTQPTWSLGDLLADLLVNPICEQAVEILRTGIEAP